MQRNVGYCCCEDDPEPVPVPSPTDPDPTSSSEKEGKGKDDAPEPEPPPETEPPIDGTPYPICHLLAQTSNAAVGTVSGYSSGNRSTVCTMLSLLLLYPETC